VLEGEDFLTSLRLPHLHYLSARAGQALAVWTEDHAADSTGVPLEGEELLAGLGIPNLYRSISLSAGQSLPLPAERDGGDLAGVPLEGEHLPAGRCIPHLHLASVLAGQAFAVWAEEHAIQGSTALKGKEFLAGLRIPHLHLAKLPHLPVARGQAFAVRAE